VYKVVFRAENWPFVDEMWTNVDRRQESGEQTGQRLA